MSGAAQRSGQFPAPLSRSPICRGTVKWFSGAGSAGDVGKVKKWRLAAVAVRFDGLSPPYPNGKPAPPHRRWKLGRLRGWFLAS